jgi:beta-lactamase regulating signal transducer with metallopeptidase domain
LHFLWQGALVGILTGWVLTILEKSKASVRYAVATGALFLMAALPFFTAFRLAETAGDPVLAAVVSGPAKAQASIAAPAAPSEDAAAGTAITFGGSLLPWLFDAWLAGVAFLSLYHLVGWRWARRLSRKGEPVGEALAALARDLCQRLGIRRAVAFLESSAVSVPTVVGWLRPVVLVPASTLTGLSPRQLEAILAHELAHVRRHDYLINLLQTAVETLLFYHPAVWWVSAQVRRERENCCDDLAVAVCGDRLAYARALVDLEGLRSAPRFALAASGGSLTDRIRRLVGAPGRRSRRPWAAGLLALALLPAGAAVQLACAGKTATDEVRPSPETGRPGTWKAELQGDKLRLEMTYRKSGWGRWTSVDEYPLSQLTGFSRDRNASFELRRGAGTFHFQGSFEGKRGRGTCGFKPDPEFEKVLGQSISTDRAMELAVYDISLDYIREMKALGVGLSAQHPPRSDFFGQVHQLVRTVVDPERNDPLRRLMDLKVHDITPEYVRGLKNAGYPNLQVWQLVELKIHGIEPDYVQGLHDSGYRHLPPYQISQFKIHGITPEWLRGIVDAGAGDATPDQLVMMQIHGIDGDFVREARRNRANLSLEELVDLKIRGI